jgi:type III pantothenate kinase
MMCHGFAAMLSRQRPIAYTFAMSSPAHLIAISVGNTRTQIGLFENGTIAGSQRFANSDPAGMVTHIAGLWKSAAGEGARQADGAILLASVNDPVAAKITAAVEDQTGQEIYRVGDDVEIPIGRQLDPETITGADRLLNAAAAYDILKQACVIVDAGTAITVDFVDGEGTFHGGAIAPGAALQLKSLHEYTAALPDLAFRAPDGEAFGRNTAQAMHQGVFHGIRGMVQRLVEQYAEAYGAFPMVIATGGDATTLFEGEALIDRVVPDLTLMGIEVAARQALVEERENEGD